VFQRGYRMSAILGFLLLLAALLVPHIGATPTTAKTRATVDGRGSIQVVDEETGRVVHQFPKPAGVLREIATLRGGAVVAISQKDFTEFYDSTQGSLVRRFEKRIYAFSHGEGLAVVYTSGRELQTYAYPDLSLRHTLTKAQAGGPSKLAFSRDDRYLAVQLCNHYPLSDELHAGGFIPEKTLYWVLLFDLASGKQLSADGGIYMGRFSDDSRFYVTGEGQTIDLGSR